MLRIGRRRLQVAPIEELSRVERPTRRAATTSTTTAAAADVEQMRAGYELMNERTSERPTHTRDA